jgi:hypothetical protein
MFSPETRSIEAELAQLGLFHLSSDADMDFDDEETHGREESHWLDDFLLTGETVCSIIANNNQRISRLLSTASDVPPVLPVESESPPRPPRGSYEDVIMKRSQLLDAEPVDGLLIAVQAPQLPRLSRRFAIDAIGDSVYVWVASQPEIIESGLKYGTFELVSAAPQSGLLAVTKTLTEQNVQNRSVFHLKPIA